MNEANGWSQYEKLVLNRLDSLDEKMAHVEESLVLVRIDVAKLKVKAGIWGGLAGLVPGAIGVAVLMLGGGPN